MPLPCSPHVWDAQGIPHMVFYCKDGTSGGPTQGSAVCSGAMHSMKGCVLWSDELYEGLYALERCTSCR